MASSGNYDELLPSDGGRARVWLWEPPLCFILGSFGLRSSPWRGESLRLTCSWPFFTIVLRPFRRARLRAQQVLSLAYEQRADEHIPRTLYRLTSTRVPSGCEERVAPFTRRQPVPVGYLRPARSGEATSRSTWRYVSAERRKAAGRLPSMSVKPYPGARSPTVSSLPDRSSTRGSAASAATARPRYSGDSVPLRSKGCAAWAAITRSVRMKPGASATAATPCGRSSRAMPNAMRMTAALATS